VSHGVELGPSRGPAPPDNAVIAAATALLDRLNRALLYISMMALVLTAIVLTYSVVSRYFFSCADRLAG
jgi:hypothetical protein